MFIVVMTQPADVTLEAMFGSGQDFGRDHYRIPTVGLALAQGRAPWYLSLPKTESQTARCLNAASTRFVRVP